MKGVENSVGIVSVKKSNIDSSKYIVTTKCVKCGSTNAIAVDNVSDLHHFVCDKCGNIEIQYCNGNGIYKDTKTLLKGVGRDVEDSKVGGNYRSGFDRITAVYGKLSKKNKINLEDFPDKDTFINWSYEHGYKDWKTIEESEDTKVVDKNSKWVTSKWGVNSDKGKDKDVRGANSVESYRQAYVSVARNLNVVVEDGKESIEKAISNCDNIENNCKAIGNSVEDRPEIREVLNRLSRIKKEYESLTEFIESKFV